MARSSRVGLRLAFSLAALTAGCSTSSSPHHGIVADASDDRGATPVTDSGANRLRSDGVVPSSDAGSSATCITPRSAEDCTAPEMTALPLCRLSLTGCMAPQNPTAFASRAVSYQVNSPLWSDGAAKTRAFVLPAGGKIDVDPLTGKWQFPVGTVLIKNFLFDGKFVETRLFMHVDAPTSALIGNGTDWVGYNYEWNEQQTEAIVVPDARTAVAFDTGKRTVTWNFPSFSDCIGCHSAPVGPIGPETDQMNRVVGSANQIDTFAAVGLFDTAPKKPYAAALVEPYANAALGLTGPPPSATVDQRARSYLSANCGFCHRPDVNDQGFDLRYGASLAATGICGLPEQNGIPGMATTQLDDFEPGDHAESAMWIRMNERVPASDPGELEDVGRMPPAGSFDVDTQATALIAQWIDSYKTCPQADGGT